MNTSQSITIVLLAMSIASCGDSGSHDTREQVNRVATEFLDGYFQKYPEEAAEFGYVDGPLDRFGDHSQESNDRWDDAVDAWLRQLSEIDSTDIDGTPEALTYVFTRERLQNIVDAKVCRFQNWNISPVWTGWQSKIVGTLASQPVATSAERAAALARAEDIPRYIDTEINNLRIGLDEGYLAPQSNVIAVINQIASLIGAPVEDSPLASPASRSEDPAFVKAYQDVLTARIVPALARYRDFLDKQYQGRDAMGVGGNPDGESCYAAAAQYWSSVSISAVDIHQMGIAEMLRIHDEMQQIAKDHFGTDDLSSLFDEMRTNDDYLFNSEEEMLDYVKAAVSSADQAMDAWFEVVPDVELIIYPAPQFEKDSGGGFYTPGQRDGKDVGFYKVGTYNPTQIPKAGAEATAFHETWPGHHLQGTIAASNESLHPIMRFMYVSGTGEGWGLYAERLSDEIGLYSSPLSRLGMLSNEAWRAARLVVDPGLHVLGWTRQQAIDYMLQNTAAGYDGIVFEVDRYAAVPGQATSYMIGSLDILRLRRLAEAELGDRFDIKQFHSRVLENGAVTIPMMRAAVESWIKSTTAQDD